MLRLTDAQMMTLSSCTHSRTHRGPDGPFIEDQATHPLRVKDPLAAASVRGVGNLKGTVQMCAHPAAAAAAAAEQQERSKKKGECVPLPVRLSGAC